MDKETAYIEPRLSLKEEFFDIDAIPESILNIEIGKTYFRFAVKFQNRFVYLEEYSYPENLGKNLFLEELLNQHAFLSARFWKDVKIILHSDKKTVIPTYIDASEALLIWESLYGKVNKNHQIGTFILDRHTLIYQANKDIKNLFENFYVNKPYEFIPPEAAQIHLKDQSILYSDGLGFNIAWSNVTFNSYYHEDWQKLTQISLHKKMVLIGEITEYAKAYRKMEAAQLDISLGSIPRSINISPLFRDLPQHRYFIIFSI